MRSRPPAVCAAVNGPASIVLCNLDDSIHHRVARRAARIVLTLTLRNAVTSAGEPLEVLAPDPFDELRRKRRPTWIYALLFAVPIAALGVRFIAHRPAPAPTRYITASVTRGDVVQVVQASGAVRPLDEVQVSSQISGRIVALHADFNSRVHRGDLLAELDPVPYESAVAQAHASLAATEAALARDRANATVAHLALDRATSLRAHELNSVADLESARASDQASRAQVVLDESEVDRARAALRGAETNLAFCRIYAPIDGIVIRRAVDLGQTVAASYQAPVLFVLANDLTRMRIVADIDESDVGKLRLGIPVAAHVEAYPGDRFSGTVQDLRFGPVTNTGTVSYPAVVDIPNADLRLRPGMSAEIRATTAVHRGVLRIPNAALRYRPGAIALDESRGASASETSTGLTSRSSNLYLLRNGHAVPVTVQVGISDGQFTEVQSPELRPGVDVVIDEGDDATSDSIRVARDKPRLF